MIATGSETAAPAPGPVALALAARCWPRGDLPYNPRIVSRSILERVAAGERDAVAACVDRYGPLVWSIARRLAADPADAEDAVQEVFIDLWNSAARFDPGKAAEATFVATIARRRLIDRLRRRSRRPVTEELERAAAVPDEMPGTDPELQADAARALAVMRELKPEQRRVIRLSIYQGWSHSAIAESLGMPLGTVKTHLRRGLLAIRERLSSAPGREAAG